MTDLLPCPFCGATDPLVSDTGSVWIKCPSCFAEGPVEETEDAAIGLWNRREGIPDLAQGVGNSGETAQPVTGPMRFDLMLEKIDGENAQNGETFNDMRAHIWAAGASHEDADFITRMLTRKGLYLFQTEPWKRCPSTHCERRGECAGPRDCTVKCPSPSIPSTHEHTAAAVLEDSRSAPAGDNNTHACMTCWGDKQVQTHADGRGIDCPDCNGTGRGPAHDPAIDGPSVSSTHQNPGAE